MLKIDERFDKERNELILSINGNEIAAIGTYNVGEQLVKISATHLSKEELLYIAYKMETDTEKQLRYILENDPLGVLRDLTPEEKQHIKDNPELFPPDEYGQNYVNRGRGVAAEGIVMKSGKCNDNSGKCNDNYYIAETISDEWVISSRSATKRWKEEKRESIPILFGPYKTEKFAQRKADQLNTA